MANETEKTIETYRKHAREYTAKYLDPKVMSKERTYFMEQLKGKVILDIGCGPGRDAKAFSEKGYHVTGIDATPEMITHAKEYVPTVDFSVMDMRKLDFPDAMYDGIWSCGSFCHVSKREAKATLREFYRVLKPEGILFVSVQEGTEETFRAKTKRYDGEKRFFADYSISEFQDFLEKTQLSVLAMEKDRFGEIHWLQAFARKT